MCDDADHLVTSSDLRRAWINPNGAGWRKVKYANVGGVAVFEGCIVLGKTADVEAHRIAMDKEMRNRKRQGESALEGVVISGPEFRWPNRTIPYILPANFPDPQRVKDAIAHWHAKTSIWFKPHAGEKDHILFVPVPDMCASQVGKRGGRQEVVLRDTCSRGSIIHELGHVVGLWHEQSREDRTQVLDVVRANVIPHAIHNFNQHISDGDDVGSYDLASIMHYGLNAFSRNGQPTMRLKSPLPPSVTRPPLGVPIGQRDGLSAGDVATVETIYANIPKPKRV